MKDNILEELVVPDTVEVRMEDGGKITRNGEEERRLSSIVQKIDDLSVNIGSLFERIIRDSATGQVVRTNTTVTEVRKRLSEIRLLANEARDRFQLMRIGTEGKKMTER